MIQWIKLGENDEGKVVYQRINEDGLPTITAIKGYRELDDYLSGSEPETE